MTAPKTEITDAEAVPTAKYRHAIGYLRPSSWYWSSLPALAKGALAFLGALALSWGVAVTVRRIPAVARVV
jgi:hypothetical protein